MKVRIVLMSLKFEGFKLITHDEHFEVTKVQKPP